MEELADFNKTNSHWDEHEKLIHEWFIMRSPIPLAAIMSCYWIFVLKLGPMYMKKKEPLHVKKYLVAYNIFQVLFSLYTTCKALYVLRTYSLFPSICPGDPKELRILLTRGCYIYLIAKLSELFDTIFFVLKKNKRQITFLHVYHHSITIIMAWIAIKIDSVNPSGAFIVALNGIVHIVMYTYYGLSAFPSMTKHLWWKKYITTLQLVQFCVIILHHFVSYKIARCNEFNIIFVAVIFHLFLFVYLFLNFYIKTYTNRQKTSYIGSKAKCNDSKKIKQN
ncbi:elongation of very long chain fatty acids protein 7-like [Pararge aegeria]|uniref:elongation of very long chain fatty acids protein 7-like n=1 Tax=Pararge aegeria TaxID=116150 RepID=UPI0019D1A5C6|nr:elongation of very long chain fatty acids protein 7-like [Pararge aegeria]